MTTLEQHQGRVGGFADAAAWNALTGAESLDGFASAWLGLQCRLIGDVERGVVVLREAGSDDFRPHCWWPADADAGPGLPAVAELALAQRRGVVRRQDDGAGQGRTILAWPLLVADEPAGVVAIEAAVGGDARAAEVMRLLQWGAVWWQARLAASVAGEPGSSDLTPVLGVLVTTLDQRRLEPAATAMATELAVSLDCDRVACGLRSGRQTRVRALSHSADFNRKGRLMRDLAAAMDEAIDQQAMVVLPAPADDTLATHAHRQLAEHHDDRAVCSVALSDAGRMIGALTLERAAGPPFTAAELAQCRHLAVLLGPVLEAKRREERWIGRKVWDAGVDLLRRLLGPGRLGRSWRPSCGGLTVFQRRRRAVWISAPGCSRAG